MARYIDIEAVGIGKAKREQFLVPEYADGWNNAIELFENEPTADVEEVKHGEWIYRDSDLGWQKYECSNCNTLFTFYDEEELSNYCSKCGAKMDGGDAE